MITSLDKQTLGDDMKSYIKLVNKALSLGFTVSVFDGECWDVRRSTNRKEIIDMIEAVEEAQLRFRDTEGNRVGWAFVSSAIDLEDDETVIDYTVTEWIEQALA